MGLSDVTDVKTTMHGERVKVQILQAGLKLWRENPAFVSAKRIGAALGLTHSGCLYHYGSSAALRDAVAEYAVAAGDPVVVPQLITANHPAAAALTQEARAAYLAGC